MSGSSICRVVGYKRDWRDRYRGVEEVIDGGVCFSVGDEVQMGCQPTG